MGRDAPKLRTIFLIRVVNVFSVKHEHSVWLSFGIINTALVFQEKTSGKGGINLTAIAWGPGAASRVNQAPTLWQNLTEFRNEISSLQSITKMFKLYLIMYTKKNKKSRNTASISQYRRPCSHCGSLALLVVFDKKKPKEI